MQADPPKTRGAVFLDRDGVLNVDRGYIGSVDRFEWIAGARDAVRRINGSGLYAFIVTNQSGIARGFYTEADYRRVRGKLEADLAEIGAHIDDERFCPYHPEGSIDAYRTHSDWRKPQPGMLLDLMKHWPVDPARSVMIGDKDTDMAAAAAAGIPGHLFSGGNLDQFLSPILQDLTQPHDV